jgi:hypothetical protein
MSCLITTTIIIPRTPINHIHNYIVTTLVMKKLVRKPCVGGGGKRDPMMFWELIIASNFTWRIYNLFCSTIK